MTQPASSARHKPEFDDFLFASVGDDRNGMPLTVASVLGRIDVDPWCEATILASLPANVAAQKLLSHLVTVPAQALNSADSASLAARLVALLPAPPKPEARRPAAFFDIDKKPRRATVLYAVSVAILFLVMWATQLLIASRAPTSPVVLTQAQAHR